MSANGLCRGFATGDARSRRRLRRGEGGGAGEHVQRVDDTGNVTQAGQDDVDEEIGAAAALEEYTERREEDGEDDLDDVTGVLVS